LKNNFGDQIMAHIPYYGEEEAKKESKPVDK
jgi:hypothetical protein